MATLTDQDVEETYYNLDDIIALDAHITCTFDESTPAGIFTLLGVKAADAGKATKAEIPLWMLPTIKAHCDVTLPKAYNESMQGVLVSHAASANLEALQPDFYAVGVCLTKHLSDGQPLARCLAATLTQRIGGIVGPALQGLARPARCDSLERRLFDTALQSRKSSHQWFTTATTRKRKRN